MKNIIENKPVKENTKIKELNKLKEKYHAENNPFLMV